MLSGEVQDGEQEGLTGWSKSIQLPSLGMVQDAIRVAAGTVDTDCVQRVGQDAAG
jgi:hypothetical protein